MSIIESLRIALASLMANRMRALLTMLGVIIGVAAVIALMSIGQGVQAAIASRIEGLGTNLLFVTPGATTEGGVRSAQGSAASLTMEDARAMGDPLEAPSVLMVAPIVQSMTRVTAQGQNAVAQVTGVTEEYQWVRGVDVEFGSFIDGSQVSAKSLVAVLGYRVAATLFGEDNPDMAVGETIYMNNVPFRVIGVAESGGSSMNSADQMIFVPITTAQSRLSRAFGRGGASVISTIYVQVANEKLLEQAKTEITDLLRIRHNITGEDDFTVTTQEDVIESATAITGVLTLFLGAIAGISLLVGGIGIMNIMLVSVTERTREIGIRKAVGAKQRDVLVQFLVEAVVMSLSGGVLGVVLGAAISRLISGVTVAGTTLSPVIQANTVVLAVLFSAGVGLFFGVYPAWRAAQLHPIEALRYE